MATKKAAKKKASTRKTSSGGLKAKIQFVLTNFVSKGKDRSEAVQGLLKKYDMSINYARTLVYSHMKDAKWPKSSRSSKKASVKKSTKKTTKKTTSSKKTKKAAPASKPRKAKASVSADELGFDF